ncbi:type II toxin-antitoxin system prevent-host-death family antitoxin [Candidatus Acetothermia bacterium]|jgi:prevent-host-death family protein|nr:type II toxin-antitoxin system prevent-host-death family antitoxin [Candidatus Acetothermia bacterium]MCI2432272.1 type II toxin-antitoxin system prevent-host-death family antitoxin [Candidatus Acetothermia bacterium]MCI2436528.1 type II toxin-antitoxin system prevent-host-death family antitoxin [Candidatus Acetothermia bacterium]
MGLQQMVSATELARAFGKYLDETEEQDVVVLKHSRPVAVLMDFTRYEKLREQNEELRELLEHIAVYRLVKERERSPEEEISLEALTKAYGI